MNFSLSNLTNMTLGPQQKESILDKCIQTIDDALVEKAFLVIIIIIARPIVGGLLLRYIENNKSMQDSYFYDMMKDIHSSIYIIDYCVMIAFLAWIILLRNRAFFS